MTSVSPDTDAIQPAILARRFHADLRRLMSDRGWGVSRTSLEAGFYQGMVRYLLAEQAYPRPDEWEQLARALGADPNTVEAWKAEALAFRPRPRKGGANYVAKPVYRLKCATCGEEFPTENPRKLYCNKPVCRYRGLARWRADNPLKGRFLAAMNARGITAGIAAREAGVNDETITDWLRTRGRFLLLRNLRPVAAWLGMTVDEAAELQGGLAEDKFRETASRGRQDPKFVRRQERLRSDKKFQRRALAPAWRAITGVSRSQESRQRMSTAQQQRYQQPGSRDHLGKHHQTLRGRAQQTLRSLRRHYPDLPEDERRRRMIAEVAAWPEVGGDLQVASSLVLPRIRTARPKAGRRSDEQRCQRMWGLTAAAAKTQSGKLVKGQREIIARQVSEEESIDPPMTADSLFEWWRQHLEKWCERPSNNP